MVKPSATMLVMLTAFLLNYFMWGAQALEFPCNKVDGFGAESYQFCNQSLSDEGRVADLVSRLTTDEKIGLLVNTARAVPRLGIPSYQWWNEGLHGVANSPGVTFKFPLSAATSFPQPILTAASFNRTLWNDIGRVVSTEARAFHNSGQAGLTYWTPNINLFRDPRWGRGQETPGEDPLLTGAYAEYFVRGLQEKERYDGDASKPPPARLTVSACCKHFTAYDMDAWEGVERYGFDAVVSQQDLEDSFNPPFQACVQNGRASGLMCSYNAVNGVPSCANKNLLTTLARNTWGFDGYIVSDCDAVQNMYANHFYADPPGSVAATLEAGMDVNCGETLYNYTRVAYEENLIGLADIDMAITRSFLVQFRLGLFDGNPLDKKYGDLGANDVCSDEHQELALEAALQGIVLLKNDNDVLPFSPAKLHNIALVGPNANDTIYNMVGNYAGNPCKYVTPLQALEKHVGTVTYVAGCTETACETADIAGAAAAAAEADATVIVVGLALEQEREAFDRTDLLLPGRQNDLIMAVANSAAERPVVLVVMSGGGVDITFARDDPRVGAILWVGYPGQAGGDALAQILFGETNPGGRLPSTWYHNEFTSTWAMTKMDMRPEMSIGYPGRTYRFYTGEPIFEFGYGLSYSKFVHEFSSSAKLTPPGPFVVPSTEQLRCGVDGSPKNCTAEELQYCRSIAFRVEVVVTNLLGGPSGTDVVLLYVSAPGAGEEGLPLKQLVDFKRVAVDGGLSSTATVVDFSIEPCKHFTVTVLDEDGNAAAVFLDGVYTLSINGEAELAVRFTGSP